MAKRHMIDADLVARLRLLANSAPVGFWPDDTLSVAADEIERLRIEVIAFCGPYAADFAKHYGLPRGHLHPTHYDILARCGARMDDFVRADIKFSDA